MIEKKKKNMIEFLPGSKGVGGEREGMEEREGVGEGGRNDPNIVCTYE
jgi:hypothetical protein